MKTIQKLILSLLLLCQVLLGQLAYANNLKPIDIFNNPNLLANQWLTEPVPLSSYTEEEKRLQRLINDKTATAVQTYSTVEQDKEWTQYDHDEITPYTWKVLELDLTESNGKTFPTSLLRPNWWIRNIGADRKGNRFYLKIPDVVEGWAVVKNIRVNQLGTRLWDEARKGDFVYRPVTATFQHDSNNVQQLYFTGNDTPLEVTPEHPIYSIDRNNFVHAGSLSIGEQVKTRQGITTLEQRKQLAGTHRVYNLEVYRDHNFMVSMDSILVHNSRDKGKALNANGAHPDNNIGKNNCNFDSCRHQVINDRKMPADIYGSKNVITENTTSRGTKIQSIPNGNKTKAFEDFSSLNLSNVKVIQTKKGEMRVGVLPDGRTVKVRPSNDGGRGRYTIDIIKKNGRTEREIRYGNRD